MKDFYHRFFIIVCQKSTPPTGREMNSPSAVSPESPLLFLIKTFLGLCTLSFFFWRSGGALLQTYSWQVTQWQCMCLDFTDLAWGIIYSYPQSWCIVNRCSWEIQYNLFVLSLELCANNRIHLQFLHHFFSSFGPINEPLFGHDVHGGEICFTNTQMIHCKCIDNFSTTLSWLQWQMLKQRYY